MLGDFNLVAILVVLDHLIIIMAIYVSIVPNYVESINILM